MAAQLGEPPDEASKRAIDGNLPVSVSGDGRPAGAGHGRQVIAQLTVRRAAADGPWTFTAQVGTHVALIEAVRIVVEDQATQRLAFMRCMPRGCFAEARLDEAQASALTRRSEPAKLEHHNADVPSSPSRFPFAGFGPPGRVSRVHRSVAAWSRSHAFTTTKSTAGTMQDQWSSRASRLPSSPVRSSRSRTRTVAAAIATM